MSHAQSRRRSRVAVTVGAMALVAPMLAVAGPTAAYAETLPGTLTVTTPSNGKLAALTGKQVVVLTVSGTGATTLTEDIVSGVKLGSDTDCDDLTNYVVSSPTTVTVKTPTGGCDASSGGAEEVAILFNANADTIAKAAAITFVSPPKLALLAEKPVVAENSASQALVANQNQRFWTTGGQYVRVKAAADFAFDPRTAAALKVTLGGKDGTEVKVYAGAAAGGLALGDQMTTTNTSDATITAQAGNYLVFKTAASMDAANDTITITQNGVSKSFLTADTGAAVQTGEVITSVSPAFGKSSGGTTVKITGTGFSKVASDYTSNVKVLFCGVEATFAATPVNTAGTEITVVTPAVSNVAAGLGLTVYSGTCPVKITNATTSWSSPLTPGASFTFLNE